MFREAYAGVEKHLTWGGGRGGAWHVEVDMWNGRQGGASSHRVSSLQAFWPAVQAGAGDVRAAERTYGTLWDLWEDFEALPDFYDALNDRCVCVFVCVRRCDGGGGGLDERALYEHARTFLGDEPRVANVVRRKVNRWLRVGRKKV